MADILLDYIKEHGHEKLSSDFLVYLGNLSKISEVSPETAGSIVQELNDQRSYLKLIASENYTSIATQSAMANLLTDKYAEGVPFHRFYAGCDNVDAVEAHAAGEAKKLFGCEHAYVQPHSGADANLMAYWAILHSRVEIPEMGKLGQKNPAALSRDEWNTIRGLTGNQKLLAMDYYSGGHLTHGYRHNISGKLFDAYNYGVNRESGYVDYDEIAEMVKEIRPLVLLAGYSAYPRKINFKIFREIADSVGAVLMVDMAHFGGLVAGKVMTGEFDPVPYADIVTGTTHKTLRGPRGGFILCKEEFREAVDKGCPLVIGGPLPNIIAAKAVAFTEARSADYRDYAERIVRNANALAEGLMKRGVQLATAGTDNHLMLIDVTPFGINGRQAEGGMRNCAITLNRNSLPYDVNGPWYTSGLRIGTPAVTTLGMTETDMDEIADILYDVLTHTGSGAEPGKKSSKFILDGETEKRCSARVKELLDRYPVYPDIDLDYLKKSFIG